MALSHVFSSPVADGTNTQLVRPSNWNSAHNFFQTISGNTAGQSTFSGTNMVIQGGDNITLSANTAPGAATLIISAAAPGAGGGAAIQGSGTYTQNTGTVQFANSNGVTFGLSNNGVMTASVVPGGGAGFSAGISGGNTSGNTGTVSNQLVFAGGNNITVSGSTNAGGMSVTISGANVGGAQTGISGISAGTTQMTSGTASFADANNVSFGVNGNTITASVVPQSVQPVAVSGSNGSFNFSTLSLGNSNGLTFYSTNGSIVGSYTVPSQSAMGFSGSNGSFTASTLSFGALNGLTFYTSNGSIVGSYTDAGAGGGDGYNIVQAGTTGTTGTTWSALSASVYLNGSNGIVVSQNNSNQIAIDGSNFATAVHLEGNTAGQSSIQIQGQAMHWVGGNNITLSANGSSVTISADKRYGNVVPVGNFPVSAVSMTMGAAIGVTNNSVMCFPYSLDQNWSGDHVMLALSNSYLTATQSGQQTVGFSWGLYSNNNSTLSLISSNSMSFSVSNSSVSATVTFATSSGTAGYGYGNSNASTTAQIHSLFGTASVRVMDLYFTNTMSLSSGMYWLGLLKKEATTNTAAGVSLVLVGNAVAPMYRRLPFGVSTGGGLSQYVIPFAGYGQYNATTNALPNALSISGFTGGVNTIPCITFDNGIQP